MKGLLWFNAGIILLVDSMTCEELEERKCIFQEGKDGICDVDIETCLKSRVNEDRLEICDPVNYTEIFKDTISYTPFRLDLVYRTSRSDLTYGLASIDGETDNWRIVKDCCNLKSGQTCQLRPIHNDESLVLFGVSGTYACYREIYVYHVGENPWCETMEDKSPCLIFIDGKVELRQFEDASILQIRSESCIFSMPENIISVNPSKEKLLRNVPGMSIYPWESGGSEHSKFMPQVTAGNYNVSCEIRKNIVNYTEFLLDYEFPPDYVICFYFRIPGGSWKPKPDCMKHISENVIGEVWKIILVVFCGFLIILILSVILVKRVRVCVPSYGDSKEQISKHVTNGYECEEFLSGGGTDGEMSKELADVITFCVLRNDSTSKPSLYFQNSCDNRSLENNKNTHEFLGSPPLPQIMNSGSNLEPISDSRKSFGNCLKSERTLKEMDGTCIHERTTFSEDAVDSPNDSALPGLSPNYLDYTEKDGIVTNVRRTDNLSTPQIPPNLSQFKEILPESSTFTCVSDSGNNVECKYNDRTEHDIPEYIRKSQLATA